MEKRNKVIALIATGALIVAILCLILGFGLTYGWHSIIEWFSSKWAFWVYIVAGLWIIGLLYIFIGDRIRRL